MKKFKTHTLEQYLNALSSPASVPGGGSAAALVGALGAGLISMAANFSIKKADSAATRKKIIQTLRKSEQIRKQLLTLVDLDSVAYLALLKSKNMSPIKKNQARKKAQEVPAKVAKLCYQAIELIPFLIQKGNRYLVSDLEAAAEMLSASFKSAMVMVRVNQ